MKSRLLLTLCVSTLIASGCTSGDDYSTGPRPDVMDLNDSPRTSTTPQPFEPAPIPTPPPEPPAVAQPVTRTHTIVAKDTFWSIATQYYGDGKQWTKIQSANPDVDPTRMPLGKKIVIP